MEDYTEKDILRTYLKEIAKSPLLTREEELELAKRIENGDRSAREKMIQSNLRFVVSIAKKYQGSEFPLLDLISYGNEGLLEAVNKYDSKKGKFSTYAVWWIKEKIIRALHNNSGSLTFPINVSCSLSRAKKNLGRLCNQGVSSDKAIEKVASEMGRTPKYLRELLPRYEFSVSLDAPLIFGDEEIPLVDTIPSDYPDFLEKIFEEDLKSELNHAMKRELFPKEKEILEYRFGLKDGKTRSLKKTGDIYGLSNETIRRIQNKAFEKLRFKSQKLASYLE